MLRIAEIRPWCLRSSTARIAFATAVSNALRHNRAAELARNRGQGSRRFGQDLSSVCICQVGPKGVAASASLGYPIRNPWIHGTHNATQLNQYRITKCAYISWACTYNLTHRLSLDNRATPTSMSGLHGETPTIPWAASVTPPQPYQLRIMYIMLNKGNTIIGRSSVSPSPGTLRIFHAGAIKGARHTQSLL